MESFVEVTVAQTVQPKKFHSIARGVTVRVPVPPSYANLGYDGTKAWRECVENDMKAAVRASIEEALTAYGKTYEQVCIERGE